MESETDSCGCSTRHPLERDGTSQAQRLLAALNTSFVSVDERRIEDLLVFARDYAKLLNFHKVKFDAATGKNILTTEGDWDVFLRKDVSVLVAGVSKIDIGVRRIDFKRSMDALNQSADVAGLKKLFGHLKSILTELNEWYTESDERTTFHKEMNVYFQSVFLEGYLKMFAVDGGATAIGEVNGLEVLSDLAFNSKWTALIAGHGPAADPSVYEGDTTEEQIKAAAFVIQTVFEKFAGTLQMIVQRAPVYLAQTVEEYPYHKAHMGLFITFLELFGHAQNHLNKITDRHLNFFYQEVLKIAPKKAVADKVHLIFQLAKNITEPFKVDEDVEVKAGKDAKGLDLFYGTDDSIVVSQAKVALFKNIFIDRITIVPDSSKPDIKKRFTGIFGAPVANSSDGSGGELDKALPQWKAFGSSQQGLDTSLRTLPDVAAGFAIASPQLALSEGNRKITVKVFFESAPDVASSGITATDLEKPAHYKFGFTGEKGWLVPDVTSIEYKSGQKELWFTFTVKPIQPAIASYKAAVHGGTFATVHPLIKIELLNFKLTGETEKWNNVYAALRSAVVKKINIDLDIREIHNLTLHNEFSAIDPSKPFMPFGQQPVLGSAFYVGSEEIFFKPLKTLDLNLTWHGVPDDLSLHYANYIETAPANSDFKVNGYLLTDRSWSQAPYKSTLDQKSLFHSATAVTNGAGKITSYSQSAKTPITLPFDFSGSPYARATDQDEFDPEIRNATRGYLKLVLDGHDFMHSVFATALASAAVNETTLPYQPYTPVIRVFSAAYTSELQLDSHDQFFHLHPFGEQEVGVPPVSDDPDNVAFRYLLPQFVRSAANPVTGKTERREQKGMLFIGLEGVVPQQSLSLLVQVVEDSGNNDAQAPAIHWSYLRNNEWIGLNRQQVASDTSNGFQTSGIVELDIPRDATNTNTIFPSGYHWLRASVEEYIDLEGWHDPSALNNVLNITAQAVQASFRDKGNDPTHLAVPLEAGTITKFADPIAEVKSIAQPYASFGGKVAEQGTDYYRRVSERLRHKGRAITMWDYERLILEHFPSVYKVKCISHTLDLTGLQKTYSELAPGNICVTVVSNLRNQNQVNLLKPTTSINTRNEIVKFLAKRASRFARISVINPEYESIQVKCNVTYLPEFQKDKGYYDKELIADIRKFLSPWAYDEGADIVFGGKIHSSYIINFIEERPYVDYLTDFEMYRLPEAGTEEDKYEPEPKEEISASHAKTILVSADTHLINSHSESL